MSAGKHTRGPWWSPDGKTIKQDYRPLTEVGGCIIAVVMGGSTSGPFFIEEDEQVAANARLLAAAPDLLDALIDCRRALEIANFTGELAVVNAAIAKATGSSK